MSTKFSTCPKSLAKNYSSDHFSLSSNNLGFSLFSFLSSCPQKFIPSSSFPNPRQLKLLSFATAPSKGAHVQVRAPPPSSSSSSTSFVMAAQSNPSFCLFFILLLALSDLHLVYSSDSDILLEFKDSLGNGDKLTSWNPSKSPCNGNRANWDGVLCTNGTVFGIQLEGKGLQGTVNAAILARMQSLLTVSFQNNSLEGSFPEFNKLNGLRTIYLSNNKFSGDIQPNAFDGLPFLRKVYLANNEFTGLIPQSLGSLPRLRELMLENNQFQGEIPIFNQEERLTKVNFSNNQLVGTVPEGLQKFNASSFSGNSELCGAPLGECKKVHISIATIIIIVMVVAAALAAIATAFMILRRRKQLDPPQPEDFQAPGGAPPGHKKAASADLDKMEQGGDGASPDNSSTSGKKGDQSQKLTFLRDDRERFDLPDLLKASAEILGSGVFGSTYKAALTSGKVMVVKRFRQMNNVGKEEFQEHMRRLGKLRHPNLLPLVAYYYRKEEKLLVSDYVENVSLAVHLHGNKSHGVRSPDWPTRLKIVKGVARGLLNLYNELPSLIAPHGHLKSSNVLLTRNYEPLVTDYGLVPITNQEHAQDLMIAYKSPEYKQLGRITKKTDVWSLGILILEILTGKFPANSLHQGKGSDTDLATFVNSVVREELTIDVFDKDMGGFNRANEGEMVKLLKIGLSCCEADPDRRWDIKEVVERIEEVREKDTDDEFYTSYSTDTDGRSSRGLSEDFTN